MLLGRTRRLYGVGCRFLDKLRTKSGQTQGRHLNEENAAELGFDLTPVAGRMMGLEVVMDAHSDQERKFIHCRKITTSDFEIIAAKQQNCTAITNSHN